jgi:hypothetical protein
MLLQTDHKGSFDQYVCHPINKTGERLEERTE